MSPIGKSRGFTLIEIMITVAIIGIIAGIAIPSFSGYLVKGTRSAAHQFMLQIANKQEQYLLDRRAYFIAANNAAFGAAPINLAVPNDVGQYYNCQVTQTLTVDYTISCAPIAGKRMGGDPTLTLNNLGQKGGTW